MADNGAPPEKRMRYNLKSAGTLLNSAAATCAQQLRSEGIVIANVELPKRKIGRNQMDAMMDLNSDCLFKMFEFLSPYDLSNLTMENKRLNDLAQYHFWYHYRVFNFSTLLEDGFVHMEKVEQVLRVFGHHIVSLAVPMDFFDNEQITGDELLLSISRYCSSNLKALLVNADVEMNISLMQSLVPMLKNLEVLEFGSGWIDWDSNAMEQLRVLRLVGTNSAWTFFSFKLPRLTDLQLICVDYQDDDKLIQFLTMNPSIEKLTIVHCFGITTAVFDAIGKLSNLKELDFHHFGEVPRQVFQTDLNHLCSLRKLKSLKLNCSEHSVANFLRQFRANTALEFLELSNGPIDRETFEHINSIKTLKVLKLNNMVRMNNSFMMVFARELPLLAEFHIKSNAYITRTGIRAMVRDANQMKCLKIDAPSFKLDLDAYQEMLTAIQMRAENNFLELAIYDEANHQQLAVPSDVINGPNQEWFLVKMLDRKSNHIFPVIEVDDDETDTDDDDSDDDDSSEEEVDSDDDDYSEEEVDSDDDDSSEEEENWYEPPFNGDFE